MATVQQMTQNNLELCEQCGVDKICIGPDRITDCSFRFGDFTWFGISFSVFVKNTNGFSHFFPVRLQSERQLSASTDLEQLGSTLMLSRGMRDKTNFAKITSRWLNIVGIHGRSRVSNGTQDFDLAMRSTKVDRFANYSFQRASRTSNLRSSKTLRNNCGLYCVFLT